MIKNADIKKEVQKAASGKNVQQLFSYVVLCGIFLKKFVRKFIHYESQLHLRGPDHLQLLICNLTSKEMVQALV